MQFYSFRIKNYRSIKDSQECFISEDNVTILAGKNEAGKTAILEALEDFNRDNKIREDAIPINQPDLKPEIEVTFAVDQELLKSICETINTSLPYDKPLRIKVLKKYPDSYLYYLPDDIRARLNKETNAVLDSEKTKVNGLYSDIKRLHSTSPQVGGTVPQVNYDAIKDTITKFTSLRNTVNHNAPNIPDPSVRANLINSLNEILEILNSINQTPTATQNFLGEFREYIPNFILFSSFEDLFPSEISIATASENDLVSDLDIISNLNLDLITSGSVSARKRHKEQLNIRLQQEYKNFWTQDFTNLCVDWDSQNLQFFISENGYYYAPNMRSKGKQWHLSFYIRITARSREDVDNILLIDEPGLYLHPQAQRDIIKKLEDCAKDAPILFSTHSPYLMDINHLNRIRLVLKPDDKTGTVISNKIHAGTDVETLTPIITAIGLDLSLGLDVAKDHNIIFEGISDYYYVRAMIEVLGYDFGFPIHLIPGCGASKVDILASLLQGWGLKHCIVLDNDAEGKRVKQKLQDNFKDIDLKLVMVSEKPNEEIEDLFTLGDFKKHIFKDKFPEGINQNSHVYKQKGKKLDKVLLAKQFYEAVQSHTGTFTATTKKRFKDLFDRIKNELH